MVLQLVKDKGGAGANGDENGLIQFIGDDANQDQVKFSEIKSISVFGFKDIPTFFFNCLIS